MNIAHFTLSAPTALAPMAGITDNPFRRLCRAFGAGWTVGEMISGDPTLRHTRKTLNRIDFSGENSPIVVQIAGAEPQRLAAAAAHHAALGADVIDINMGCPAKKVCRAEAGSALMKNEKLVAEILRATVAAVNIPVTLKTRLGWDDEHLNVLDIARIAQDAGITALAIHGRSRTQMYRGRADYRLIATVKRALSIPVWVNGDITTPEQAQRALEISGADGVMIGRGAQGRPWLFREIAEYLRSGSLIPTLPEEKVATVLQHLQEIYTFYGAQHGVRIARKHIAWYVQDLPEQADFRRRMNELNDAALQYEAVAEFLQRTMNRDT
ncbi:MAG: tRNA dihydrouridine synthase DusB [Neisseria sp.]|nr:tRNA dihydrouridine synthase DusB [Neisseria sp.]